MVPWLTNLFQKKNNIKSRRDRIIIVWNVVLCVLVFVDKIYTITMIYCGLKSHGRKRMLAV